MISPWVYAQQTCTERLDGIEPLADSYLLCADTKVPGPPLTGRPNPRFLLPATARLFGCRCVTGAIATCVPRSRDSDLERKYLILRGFESVSV